MLQDQKDGRIEFNCIKFTIGFNAFENIMMLFIKLIISTCLSYQIWPDANNHQIIVFVMLDVQ